MTRMLQTSARFGKCLLNTTTCPEEIIVFNRYEITGCKTYSGVSIFVSNKYHTNWPNLI